VVLAVWAEPVLRLLYGRDFVAGAPSMRVLALSAAPAFLVPLTNYVMTSIGRQGPSVAGVLAGVLVNAAVNVFMVPSHGHLGAAVGYTAGTVTAISVNGGLVRGMLGRAGLAAVAWRPLLAAALAAAVGAAVGTSGALRALGGLALAGATFCASLLALRAVTAGELAALRALRGGPPGGLDSAPPAGDNPASRRNGSR